MAACPGGDDVSPRLDSGVGADQAVAKDSLSYRDNGGSDTLASDTLASDTTRPDSAQPGTDSGACPAESSGNNACDGEDDDCDGVKDNGTFIVHPVRTAEWIHGPTATQLLGSTTKTSLLLMNTGNSPAQLAIYDWAAKGGQGEMKGANHQARAGLNGLIKSGPSFTQNPVGGTHAATVYVPAGFVNGSAPATTSDDLWLINDSELHRIELSTGLHQVASLSSLELKTAASSSAFLTSGVVAATYLPVGALPGSSAAYFLFVGTADRCWLWDSQNTAAGFQGPVSISACLCPAGSTGCPADAFATPPDSLAYVGDQTLLAFRGDTIYVGAIKNSSGTYSLEWTPLTFGSASAQYAITCTQP